VSFFAHPFPVLPTKGSSDAVFDNPFLSTLSPNDLCLFLDSRHTGQGKTKLPLVDWNTAPNAVFFRVAQYSQSIHAPGISRSPFYIMIERSSVAVRSVSSRPGPWTAGRNLLSPWS